MNSDKPSGGLPLFTSKKSGSPSGKKSVKDLLLILVPLLVGGIFLSWGLGRLVGHRSNPDELFPVVFQGPGQARRAALGEWAYQLQTLDMKKAESLRSPWLPSSSQTTKLLRLLTDARGESDTLYRASLLLVLGFSQNQKSEVAQAITDTLLGETETQTTIQALFALARLHEKLEPAPELVTRLQSNPDASIRKALAFALGAGLWSENNAVRPILYTLVHDTVDDVRWNAAFALASKKDPESTPVLRELLQRAEAMKGPQGEPLTSELLSAFTEGFRWAVQSGDSTLVEEVRTISKGHPNLKVRQAALAAFETQN